MPAPASPRRVAAGFNATSPMSMAAHAIKHAVAKSGVELDFVEDCHLGNNAHGAANIGRLAALLAGMPVNTAGVTINRFCSSGLQAIAMGADYIRSASGGDCVVAGGVESISIPGGGMGGAGTVDPELMNIAPAIFMAMIDTADIVAKRYNISREYQDEYSLQSQQRMAAAQAAGLFADEIVPMATKMKVVNKETKEESMVDYVVNKDECNRPETTLEGLAFAAAGQGSGQLRHRRQRCSQLSDGCRRGDHGSQGSRTPRPRAARPFRVLKAAAGCEPDEMGIGPASTPCPSCSPARA